MLESTEQPHVRQFGRRRIVCAIVLLVLAVSFSHPAAETFRPIPEVRQQREDRSFVLLIDASGSMKKTDPLGLRIPAAELFVSLLDPHDAVGMVRFGDSAGIAVAPAAGDDRQKQAVVAGVRAAVPSDSFTNIPAALRAGFDALQKNAGGRRFMILLSDGRLDLGSPEQDEKGMAELEGILDEIRGAGIRVWTIAFTAAADTALLERISRQTDGFSRLAKTDQELHAVFAALFEQITSPDSVPFSGNAFTIDAAIEEAILLVSKTAGGELSVQDPAGRAYAAARSGETMRWLASPAFDLVAIRNPAPGRWKVSVTPDEGSRVFVITDLKLVIAALPEPVMANQGLRIEAWLEQDSVLLNEPGVMKRLSLSSVLEGPDGKSRAAALFDLGSDGREKEDGIYSSIIPVGKAGDYTIRITAETGAFSRQKLIAFRAVEPGEETHGRTDSAADGAGAGSWRPVLIRFLGINLLLVLIAGAALILRRKRKQKKEKPDVQ